MDDSIISYVNAYVTIVTNQVARFCVRQASHAVSGASLCGRGTRKGDSKVSVYTLYETRTVSTIREAGSAVHVRVAKELFGIVYNGLTKGRRVTAS